MSADRLYIEDLRQDEFLEEDEEDEDGQVAVWQVKPWGLMAISGGAEDWDWEHILRNGGLGDIKRRPAAREFLVRWEINLTASSAEEAAERALFLQRDPNYYNTVFEVIDVNGLKTTTVDLA